MIGEIWIQANMTEDGTVHLLVAPGIADRIKDVVVYEIGSPDVKGKFEEENDDPHTDI
jgi:hypothetical protein|nr:MAG TPA: XisI protein-like protein [Caudoviricetes sp.]